MPALAWLDEQLAASGTSADELVRVELQNQAATNVTVRNVITSMRTMAAFDWAEFFEGVSLIDEALRADSDFGAMDFATRDRYRHAIEELARGSRRSELEVTREVIAHAKGPRRHGRPARLPEAAPRIPAYYLISDGLLLLEKAIGYRVPLKQRLLRAYVSWATPGYLGTLGIVTALLLALPLLLAHAGG